MTHLASMYVMKGYRMKFTNKPEYDGKDDAESLLEGVLGRKRWSVDIRDDLALRLIQVHLGYPLRPKPKRDYSARVNRKINHA